MAKIAVLIGSQRINGNTRKLANSFIEGAKEHNTIDVIIASDYDIPPCTGCNSCFKTDGNRCIHRDEMDSLVQRISSADIIVIATPIYFFTVSTHLKKIIDRLHFPGRREFNTKGLVLLAVAHNDTDDTFDSIRAMYDSSLRFFKLKDLGSVCVPGVRDPGDINGRKELEEARELGKSISDSSF